MGHRHSKDDILAGAVATAFDVGLSQVTYGRVAAQLGISDRTIVYYFPTKDDLVSEVLLAVGARLQTTLAPTLQNTAADHLGLLQRAWPVLARPSADPVFGLFFEAAGLAAAGRDPYRTLLPALMTAWVDWAAEFVEGTPSRRRAEAEAAIALLDGLLLLRTTAGAAAANRAARVLGIH